MVFNTKKILGFILIAFPLFAVAQYRFDAGIGLGGCYYFGDIGGKSIEQSGSVPGDISTLPGTAFSIFARYNIRPLVSIKGMFTYLTFEAADINYDNVYRRGRNLHFRNTVHEFLILGEFAFFQREDITFKGQIRVDFELFASAGLGLFKHNPEGHNKLRWIELQPIGTEGQGRTGYAPRYSLIQPVIPLGAGFHFTLNRQTRLGIEFFYRKTFTDYLDDISTVYPDSNAYYFTVDEGNPSFTFSDRSGEAQKNGESINLEDYRKGKQRGNSDNNDTFITFQLTISYVIRGKTSFYRSQYNSTTRVPKKQKRKTRTKF